MQSTPRAGDSSISRDEPRARADVHALDAEARYNRDRLALYRARVLSAKPTRLSRLRELERISSAADARLRHARGR